MRIAEREWSGIKHFIMAEYNAPRAGRSARYDMMDRDEIFLMDFLRREMNVPFTVTSAWSPGTGHTKKSLHYDGLATDGRWTGLDIIEASDRLAGILWTRRVRDVRMMHSNFLASNMEISPDTIIGNLIGIGIYTGGSLAGGFHIDLRLARATWGYQGAVNAKGAPVYVSYEKAYEDYRANH